CLEFRRVLFRSAASGGNPLGNNGAPGILTHVDNFGASVRLLQVVGQSYGVELTNDVVTFENHTGIFPGNGRAGLYLGPGNLGVATGAESTLGHEVVDAAFAFMVAGIPVLYRGVLDLGAIQSHQLDYGRVQLVFVSHRSGTTFQIAHVRTFVGDDQGAFELTAFRRVDPEVGGQL